MSARNFLITVVVLLGACALVAGCGDESTSPTAAEAPILPPQNIVTTQSPSGEIVITWDANTQSHLRGYNLYRRDVQASSIQRLTASPILETRHVDNSVFWQREYEYRVTSVSNKGTESAFVASTIHVDVPITGDRRRPKD